MGECTCAVDSVTVRWQFLFSPNPRGSIGNMLKVLA